MNILGLKENNPFNNQVDGIKSFLQSTTNDEVKNILRNTSTDNLKDYVYEFLSELESKKSIFEEVGSSEE